MRCAEYGLFSMLRSFSLLRDTATYAPKPLAAITLIMTAGMNGDANMLFYRGRNTLEKKTSCEERTIKHSAQANARDGRTTMPTTAC